MINISIVEIAESVQIRVESFAYAYSDSEALKRAAEMLSIQHAKSIKEARLAEAKQRLIADLREQIEKTIKEYLNVSNDNDN